MPTACARTSSTARSPRSRTTGLPTIRDPGPSRSAATRLDKPVRRGDAPPAAGRGDPGAGRRGAREAGIETGRLGQRQPRRHARAARGAGAIPASCATCRPRRWPNTRAGSRRCRCAPSARNAIRRDQARMLELAPFADSPGDGRSAPMPKRGAALGTGGTARAAVRAGTRREGRGLAEEAGAARAATAPGILIT